MAALREVVGGPPLLAELLARRNITDPERARAFLDPDFYKPAPPEALPDLIETADRLREAIRRGEKILVWGDFDVDGITSTALLVGALREFGADVDYYVPHRLTESHGIQTESLREVLDSTGARVLLTCDTGSDEGEALMEAKRRGVATLITDHHALPADLPGVDALVNPERLPADHPLHDLSGVGVAYQLVRALDEDTAARQLDLVALGLIADVVELRADNRYLVQRGLKALTATGRPGLRALFEIAGVGAVDEEAVGFQIAPRMNALGRLGHAGDGVRLLLTDDRREAVMLAERLEALNNERRHMTEQTYAAAQRMIADNPSLLDYEMLLVDSANWHPGIVGIVAGRLAERYDRPAAVIVTAPDGSARGSARAPDGYDLARSLQLFQDRAGLLENFGGHPGAAGFSLQARNLPRLRRQLSNILAATRSGELPGLSIDAWLPLPALNMQLAESLRKLAPFGQGNPAPVFGVANAGVAVNARTLDRAGKHRILTLADNGHTQKVIWWSGGAEPEPVGRHDVAVQVGISTYGGKRELQIVWVAARPCEVEIEEGEKPPDVLDYRREPDPLAALDALRASEPSLVVWSEGADARQMNAARRLELGPAVTLAIWTTPPGPRPLADALAHVKPQKIAIFAQDPPAETPRTLRNRLLGMAKFAMSKREGITSLEELAAALAQDTITVRTALESLHAHRRLRVDWLDDGSVSLSPPEGAPLPFLEGDDDATESLLDETRAYRAYFGRADAVKLITRAL